MSGKVAVFTSLIQRAVPCLVLARTCHPQTGFLAIVGHAQPVRHLGERPGSQPKILLHDIPCLLCQSRMFESTQTFA